MGWSDVRRLGLIAAVALSCATGNKLKPEPPPPRVQDGAPDKLAAQRAAAPQSLQLEVEHERWGYEAAGEMKEWEKEKNAAAAKKATPPTAKSVGVTGQPPGATPAQPTPPAPPPPTK
jgi:hypothetical protein